MIYTNPALHSRFEPALEYLAPIEGEFSDHQSDPGGATKWGISLRFLRGVNEDLNGDGEINLQDILDMTAEEKDTLYRQYFWDWYKIYSIRSQAVANRAFSLFVHMPTKDAASILQRAARACLQELVVDGRLGDKSFRALNACDDDVLLAAIRATQAAFYEALCDRRPELAVYRGGWLNRAYRL